MSTPPKKPINQSQKAQNISSNNHDEPNILLELLTGKEEAALNRPFLPDENEIAVTLSRNDPKKVYPIFELLVNTAQIKRGIKEKAPTEEIRAMALENGMRTLRMDGVDKIFQGKTDLSGIVRVC
jgi:type II secretory ATPase GspE/PulE/Tfp pilus assembly ATPase PilB-like protein